MPLDNSSQPLPENQARLEMLAAALAEQVPALRLDFRSGPSLFGNRGTAFKWVGLVGTTTLIPGGLVQVVPFVKYQDGQRLPMFEVAVYEGQPPQPVIFRHIADQAVVIDLIVDWATGPLRTGAGRRRPAAELETRARRDVIAALVDARKPPGMVAGQLPGADPAVIAFFFPRDQRGKMRGSARVLVELLGGSARKGRSRCRFIQLQGDVFSVYELDEFVENQDHRWHGQTWRWQRSSISPLQRWGIDDLVLARKATSQLQTGEWDSAFAAWGVEIGATLHRLLNAEPLGHLLLDFAAAWATVASDQLARSAPWRLPALATKKSIRVFGLGGMNVQAKPGVNLRLVAGRPTLDLESSASNRRLAREDWERPLDFEASRLGIEPPSDLPILWPELEGV